MLVVFFVFLVLVDIFPVFIIRDEKRRMIGLKFGRVWEGKGKELVEFMVGAFALDR